MKKLFILIAISLAGWSYLRSNLGADGHTVTAGWSLPTFGTGSLTGIAGMVSTMLHGQPQPSPEAAGSQVVSLSPPNGGPQVGGSAVGGARQVSAANPGAAAGAKSGDLTIPPELLRFVNPSLLTTTPSGTQDLTPAAKLALQQIIAQVRANPAAYRDQLNVAAKIAQGSR